MAMRRFVLLALVAFAAFAVGVGLQASERDAEARKGRARRRAPRRFARAAGRKLHVLVPARSLERYSECSVPASALVEIVLPLYQEDLRINHPDKADCKALPKFGDVKQEASKTLGVKNKQEYCYSHYYYEGGTYYKCLEHSLVRGSGCDVETTFSGPQKCANNDELLAQDARKEHEAEVWKKKRWRDHGREFVVPWLKNGPFGGVAQQAGGFVYRADPADAYDERGRYIPGRLVQEAMGRTLPAQVQRALEKALDHFAAFVRPTPTLPRGQTFKLLPGLHVPEPHAWVADVAAVKAELVGSIGEVVSHWRARGLWEYFSTGPKHDGAFASNKRRAHSAPARFRAPRRAARWQAWDRRGKSSRITCGRRRRRYNPCRRTRTTRPGAKRTTPTTTR